MAASITGFLLDTPTYKIFDVAVPEVDAINVDTALTFAGATMQNFAGAPQTYWATEITAATDTPTVNCNMALHAVTALGFSVFKTSVTAATADVHTFRVWMTTLSLFQI